MNSDKRKSFRLQIPEGREVAVLTVGNKEFKARVLDESAGGFAVALVDEVDVQQNQVHLLKTISGLYQIRVARIEHFSDGKLLGLIRLADLSDDETVTPLDASWRDLLVTPQQSSGMGQGGIAIGIGLFALIGAVVCGIALFGVRYLPSKRSSESTQYTRDFTEAVTSEIEKARDAAAEAQQKANQKRDAIQEKVAASPAAKFARRQQAKVSAEVLYRLQLSSDQSRRIREILSRKSSDPASAEAEIRSVLTADQVQKWQSLAP